MQQHIKFFRHGIIRGLNSTLKSSMFNGKFGRMFRTLAPAEYGVKPGDAEKHLLALAIKMVDQSTGPQTVETLPDDEENTGISSGYTYLGQFLDHDITFDPASSLQKQNDPDALEDFRTPRFDLDSIYGRGPDDQPYLYDFSDPDNNVIKMLLGKELTDGDKIKTNDLTRNHPSSSKFPKRALIGDPRNDENMIVSQLQGMFLRFHNSVVDYQKSKGADAGFKTVQKIVRWHYQWMIINDFLPTIIKDSVLKKILPSQGEKLKLNFYEWRNQPYMPVEFSGAAYRFGHSMVRPIYRLNKVDRNKKPGEEPRLFIFPDLAGFGESDKKNIAIDWSLFFDFGNADAKPNTRKRVQPAYKIDTSLVNPLGHLPKSISDHIPPMPSLAHLNLIRGYRLGLPSGQDVARAMGIPVIPDSELKIGKATADGFRGEEQNPSIADIPELAVFKNNAPLWFYVLAEALKEYNEKLKVIIGNKEMDDKLKKKCDETAVQLGELGGTIVGEVFIGLLYGDQYSFVSQDPLWKPFPDFCNKGEFGIVELLKQAMKG